jgi:hypothetical protein
MNKADLKQYLLHPFNNSYVKINAVLDGIW